MSAPNPRIIVLDDANRIYGLVKSALELLGRTPRLIHTSAATDALAELQLSAVDLLVTVQALSDTEIGQFTLHAKRELATLPIVVIGEQNDPVLRADGVEYQYLRRPFAPETFLRALRIALDGPQVALETEPQAEALLHPVPVLRLDKLRDGLFDLMREARAMAAIIADRNGKVLSVEGAAGYFDRDLVGAAGAPLLASTMKMIPIVGDVPRALHYIDGKNDAFVLNVGLHHCLILIYDGKAPNGTLAAIRRTGWAVVSDMLKVIGEDVAFNVGAPIPQRPTSTTRTVERAADSASDRNSDRTSSRTAEKTPNALVEKVADPTVRPTRQPYRETARDKAPVEMRETIGPSPRGRNAAQVALDAQKAEARAAAALEAPPVPKPRRPDAPAIPNFDASIFDNLDSVDMSMADDLFDPSRLDLNAGSDKISFEDAMMQGIIGDIQD